MIDLPAAADAPYPTTYLWHHFPWAQKV